MISLRVLFSIVSAVASWLLLIPSGSSLIASSDPLLGDQLDQPVLLERY